ncbi:mammalian cell entry protein [Mycobacterium fragae]|jgi:Mce-associated membrane protein|uniref:mammalian cell entry protein n=1 Tax=Mycobacterium fragae TaxID=1260918 RepID=UPI000A15C5A6|nr:mammalian cell entry protein [Mycobacterium fragae]MCV7401187.1 mammalian cell entry protein [Mycobacterium fragae]
MAEHADTTEQVGQGLSGTRALITLGIAILVALAGVGGWLGYRVHQDRAAQAQRNLYVQVARQAAVNLTTINYTEVETDIKRILDSATGTFHDDFQNRSQPFVDVVKKVQSKSEGTVAEAGVLSENGDHAQVLVAVSVKTSIAAAPEQEPRRWRLRISVEKAGDSAKISNVEFVP